MKHPWQVATLETQDDEGGDMALFDLGRVVATRGTAARHWLIVDGGSGEVYAAPRHEARASLLRQDLSE
jgi:hypothetical protein